MANLIRKAVKQDYQRIWEIFSEIVKSGDTYAYDPNTTKEEAINYWINKTDAVYVIEHNGEIAGTYYIKANQPGLGAHVCNCGYMVDSKFRGLGLATEMCEHSQKKALKMGFKAMQFNLVVANNPAVSLWEKLGFKIIGILPGAYHFKKENYVDALIMYKWLDEKKF
ncbi:MAG: GNAT family N-acetyltransferase [Ignavibacteria bacterium]|jgi:ribosomal protein S18 acetylase RimI-like enzyme